ncbi:bifunctional ADP-dependent NAD(P)H-hydrate dehydratase/NAD(P)H-hydrate epimerase [Coxiella endosymbiont of Amblyomma americanum]|uniref:bifunctional ADP-dependent NAD(P)H-hydrate dehydratase/NAD(P)H-hydrate epimerase n=1 Tax=Coxiella endosymbiont of Amblyomma americanum TaxID=325775 RepID=UPI00057FFBB6|nr:bifunctional ADP-dependent NAD(P)H-hydrate dehydratase/NAD(P)H-hydrate epimerase [Coxiella endosymbiont of Amblyomma americanum]AJC50591.1 carbohydrate kinase [Coxiella endosymbiont of Amblyomma americanum]AUJ58924.1 bifunctional ADP-dependent NAD(P)H-hydrate dehydratase/NAD(P)H-hydrate epimerase [Coxiella-like endosymbiont of Amblyomma americanum]
MIKLYNSRQIHALEKLAILSGINKYDLMLMAGKSAFETLTKRWPTIKEIIVCCGKGNNGGDGLVVACLAHQKGLNVTIYSLIRSTDYCGPAAQAAEDCTKEGLTIQHFPVPLYFNKGLIVDALLGRGLRGEIKSPYSEIITAINAAKQPVLSLDVPSGVNIDTGAVHSKAVKADVTITFIGLKQGLYTAQAPTYCGELEWNSSGLSNYLFSKIKTHNYLLNWSQVHCLFPPRRERDSHKGNYGHVLVIGGDYGMGGAVRMSAEAAARVGAGLVTVATRPEHIPIVSGSRPELMCYQVDKADDLDNLLKSSVTVIVIGPGLGKSVWAKSLLNKILCTKIPKVLDADSLNLLAENPTQREDWILTPHPGEASRLLHVPCQKIQSNRFKAIRQLTKNYSGVVVLKGAGTLIKGKKKRISICPSGNPGMSTGGMGDILSGVIGGLLAQKLNLTAAAQVGVFIHSLAADRAAKEGGERGLLATDLFPHLRSLMNSIAQ